MRTINPIRDKIYQNTRDNPNKQGFVYLGVIGVCGRWALAYGWSLYDVWDRIREQNITAIAILRNAWKADETFMLKKAKKDWGANPYFLSNTEIFGDFAEFQQAMLAQEIFIAEFKLQDDQDFWDPLKEAV